MEVALIVQKVDELKVRFESLSSHLKLNEKKLRLEEVSRILENPDIWSDQEEAQKISKEKSSLDSMIDIFDSGFSILDDAKELIKMHQMKMIMML